MYYSSVFGKKSTYNDHLSHYGIKGQSWGVRRFQNDDGTLTEEGKQRYGVGDRRGIRDPNMGTSRRAMDEYRNMGPRPHVRRPVEKSQSKDRKISTDRSTKIKKILALVGGLALTGAVAYKYSGKLRDLLRTRAVEKIGPLARKNWEDENTRRFLKDEVKLASAELKRGGYRNPSLGNKIKYSNMLWDMKSVRRLKGAIDTRTSQINRYESIAVNATRMDAVKNLIRNRGKIVL